MKRPVLILAALAMILAACGGETATDDASAVATCEHQLASRAARADHDHHRC